MTAATNSFALLVNPHAGAGRARKQLPHLIDALHAEGAQFDTVYTRGPGDATTLVRDILRRGAAGIAVVGGDGTLNEAVNGFFDEQGRRLAPEAWLGPLPCGTGGDFRRTLGISHAVDSMTKRMMRASPRPIDVGWLRFRSDTGDEAQRAFINIASFGLGGEVDDLVNRGPKWIGGTLAFLLATLRATARYKSRRVRITVDEGEPQEAAILNMAVANGQFFGGGMHIAPKAALEDGLFDIVGLEPQSFITQARMVRHLYGGTLLGCDGVSFRRGRVVHAEPADSDRPIRLDVDGETPGSLPATFELRAGALVLRG